MSANDLMFLLGPIVVAGFVRYFMRNPEARRELVDMLMFFAQQLQVWLLKLAKVTLFEDRPERLRSRHVRPMHFLLAIAVRLLPPSERARYFEEFRAELLDVPHDTRLRHVLSLLRGVFVLRLRRGLKTRRRTAIYHPSHKESELPRL